jgi:hypothetical protein
MGQSDRGVFDESNTDDSSHELIPTPHMNKELVSTWCFHEWYILTLLDVTEYEMYLFLGVIFQMDLAYMAT